MEKLKNSKWLEVIKWAWIAAVFTAVILYVVNNINIVQAYFTEIHWSRFLLSFGLILIGKQLTMLATRLTLEGQDVPMTLWEFFAIYNLTQLGKYLPGGVWQYVGRYGTYRTQEMSNKKTLSAMMAEILWQLSTAVLIGAIFLLFFNRKILEVIGISLTPAVAVVLSIVLLAGWIGGMLLIQRLVQSLPRFNASQIARVFVLYLPAWLCLGISFGLLFPELSFDVFGMAMQGFSLSWAAGFLAFFTPAGLGVRELVMTALYAGTAYAALTPVIASVHRVLWTLVELLLGLIIVIIQAIRKTAGRKHAAAGDE